MARLAVLCVLLCAVVVTRAANAPAAPPVKGQTIPVPVVAKSSMDTRDYRLVYLPNGLNALVVSDKHTGVASASVDVGTGWWNDPEDIPGMNHFMEHMLFLGNAKYPQEGAWRSFLSSHGGTSNAYTSTLNMNFYFRVSASALATGLERFAAFFESPSFTPSAISREINAVNSENMKNLQNDVWRAQQLVQSLSNKSLPHHKFSTGNSVTLGKVSHDKLSAMLTQLHKEKFVAQNMRLCVVGQQSLDALEAMVRKEFSGLPSAPSQVFRNNTKLPAPWLYPADDRSKTILPHAQGKMIKIETVKDIRKLTLSWPMPPAGQSYDKKSLDYIGAIIGNEDKGSLLALLKERELATHMVAGSTLHTGMFQMFSIVFQLTHKGSKADNVNYILEQTMKYLSLIQRSGVNSWRWKEDGRIQAIHFRLKNKTPVASLASTLSARLRTLENPADVLIAPYVYRTYDQQAIETDLVRLNPRNMIVIVAKRNHSSSLSETEKWYGTKYDVSSLALAHLVSLRNSTADDIHMKLPGPNPFVPTSLNLKDAPVNPHFPFYPLVVKEQVSSNVSKGSYRVWWKQDTKFQRPIAQLVCKLWSRQLYASPADVVKGALFSAMVRDQLSGLMYPAHRAGYFYKFGSGMDGFDLSVKGYDSGMEAFVRSLAGHLEIKLPTATALAGNASSAGNGTNAGLTVSLKVFKSLKEELKQNYMNFELGQPLSHAAYTLSLLLGSPHWQISEYLMALEDVEVEHVVEWGKAVFQDVRVECLVTGNVGSDEAISIVGALTNNIDFSSNSESHFRSSDQVMRIVQVDGTYSFTSMAPNKKDPNAASYVYYQYEGEGTVTDDVNIELLAGLMSKQCFHELRTKQALGYLVFCGTSIRQGVNGIRVDVQSPKYGASFLQGRISKFMRHHMRNYLHGMSPHVFLQYRNGLLHSKGASYSTLAGETASFWLQIHSQQYNFVKSHFERLAIQKMTQKSFLEFYDNLIGHNGVAKRVNIQVESHVPRKPLPAPTQAPVVLKPAEVVIVKESPDSEKAAHSHTAVKTDSHTATHNKAEAEDPTEVEDQNLAELKEEDESQEALRDITADVNEDDERQLDEETASDDSSDPDVETHNIMGDEEEEHQEGETAETESDVADMESERGAYSGNEEVANVPDTEDDVMLEEFEDYSHQDEESEEVSDVHLRDEMDQQDEQDQRDQQDAEMHAAASLAHQAAATVAQPSTSNAEDINAEAAAHSKVPLELHDNSVQSNTRHLKNVRVRVVRTVELRDASTNTGVEFKHTGSTVKKNAVEKLNLEELSRDEAELHKEGITIPSIVESVQAAAAAPVVKQLGHGVTATEETHDTTTLKSPCGSYQIKHGAPDITVVDFCNGTKVEVQTVHCPNCPQSALGQAAKFQRIADPSCNKGGVAKVYRPRPVTDANVAAFKNGLCLFPKQPTGNFVPSLGWWLSKHPKKAESSQVAPPKHPAINVHNLGK